jgi:glycosyltransferase involved in cell wall biosynthesis
VRRTPRLLIISETLRGGVGGAVRDQSAWFDREGWSVTVASPHEEGTAEVTGRHATVRMPESARHLGLMGLATRDVRRLIRSGRPDIIHCHGLRSFVIARLASTRRPFVTLHGTGTVPSDPSGYWLVRSLGLRVAPFLAAGAFNADRAPRPGWTFTPHASPLLAGLERRPFPSAASEPTFLWLGRLAEPKHPGLFVEAIAAASRRKPIRGIIAGDGPLLGDIIGSISRLGAPVEVVGHTDNVIELIDQAWALVMFSGFEALTFSVQEGMWAGRTAVASPLPSMKWLIGDAGLLAGDLESATASILRLSDHALATRLGQAAAVHIRELVVPGSPWPQVATAYRERLNLPAA